MRKKLLFLVSCVLFLCIAANIAKAELIAYWPFDEGAGEVAADVIGGNDAQLIGATWTTSSQMGAAAIEVASNTIDCGPGPTPTTEDLTLAWWMIDNHDSYGTLLSKSGENSTQGYNLLTRQGEDSPLRFRIGGWQAYGGWGEECRLPDGAFSDGQWVHITCTYDSATDTATMYVNGELKENGNLNPKTGIAGAAGYCEGLNNPDEPLYIVGNPETFTGVLDEVAIWDNALTPEEVVNVFEKGPKAIDKRLAGNPIPDDEAGDISRDLTLAWMPGETSVTRDVFVATSFEDANNASVTDPLGALVGQDLSDTEWNPGRLAFGQTYFWRVDEANGVPDNTVFKGNIWSFTTEPYAYALENVTATASSQQSDTMGPENTVNGSGLDAADEHGTASGDMWLTLGEASPWIQYDFDKAHKLHEMWVWNSNQAIESTLGLGAKDVTIETSVDGETWATLEGAFQFEQAPGRAGYAHNTVVDLGGVRAKHVKLTIDSGWGTLAPQRGLSEVRFFSLPVYARELAPADGTADVDPAALLSWRAGREAESHDVYVSTDEQAVISGTAPVVNVAEPSYTADLDLGKTYYWKVNEVNAVEDPATWEGDIQHFSTPEYLIVDDFEMYEDKEFLEIWAFWADGFEDPSNGSIVGYGSIGERTIVHSGLQSMPFTYSNTDGATYSETERNFDDPQDWSRAGIQTLTLHLRADSLSEALDTTASFTTEGAANWLSQTEVSFDGVDAAKSGGISDNEDSRLLTTVTGAGTVSFYWKASTEADYDFLEFYLDGQMQDQISGEVDWTQMTYPITTAGSHTLEWRYFKDAGASGGEDCGWVDQFGWDGGGLPDQAPGNTGQLYAKVNGVSVNFPGDIAGITWTKWKIDLASLGMDLQAVKTLSLGIEGANASGVLYFDDFLLEPAE